MAVAGAPTGDIRLLGDVEVDVLAAFIIALIIGTAIAGFFHAGFFLTAIIIWVVYALASSD